MPSLTRLRTSDVRCMERSAAARSLASEHTGGKCCTGTPGAITPFDLANDHPPRRKPNGGTLPPRSAVSSRSWRSAQ